MIEIRTTDRQIERAKTLYGFHNLKNSITKGKSQIYGALGEVVVHDYFTSQGKKVDLEPCYDYDLIIGGYKVDVKSKGVIGLNTEHVKATVCAKNTSQKCDFYFFCQVSYSLNYVWILGYKTKGAFFLKAELKKKGDLDDDGKFIFTEDCYNLKVNQLDNFKQYE